MAVESKWGTGCDPKRAAVEYFSSTKDIAGSLGKRAYMHAVAATACAAMASARSASSVLDEDVLAKCDTILLIARYVEKLALQHVRNEAEEDEEREGRRAGKRAPSPLAKIARALTSLREKHERQQQQQQLDTQAGTRAASTSELAPPTTPTPTSSPGLPLPPAVLPAIFAHLDARSAAAAAATCRELRAAHLEHAFDLLPELFTLYVGNASGFANPQGDFNDGSYEASFVVQWPLDGSTACGADLIRSQRDRVARRILQIMRQHMLHFPVNMPAAPDNTRPAPSRYSSPLASFKDSAAVPMATSPSSSQTPPTSSSSIPSNPTPHIAARPASPPATAGPSTSTSTPSTAPAAAAAAAAAASPCCTHETLTHACCDVRVLRTVADGHVLHVDGDLLAVGYCQGWKQRDPGVQGCVLSCKNDGEGIDIKEQYHTGFYEHVTRVCADAAHGLVWAAADDGRRIKAFRAPAPGSDEDDDMSLRHTLSTVVKGLEGSHAGLHVLGDSLLAVNGCGVVMRWEVARLVPQRDWRAPRCIPGADPYSDDEEQEDEGDAYWGEPEYSGDIGWRDTEDPDELEASPGVPPHAVHLLQLPVYDMSKRKRSNFVKRTAVLADPASPAAPVLVAALNEHYGNTVLTYDMETLRVRQRLLGHLYDITGVAVPPPSWQGAPLFATASRTGDVKVWDLRSRCCSPAVTLVGGREPLEAVALAAAQGGAGQLGAGLMCFAGGAGEAVWAWDLRAGRAQALYELSTGNTRVQALAWHQATNSLLAACESVYSDRHGNNHRDDWSGGSDEGDDEDEGEEGGGGGRWWPKRAKHDRKDFKAYWTEADSCVVQYRFSGEPKQEVPESEGPAFGW